MDIGLNIYFALFWACSPIPPCTPQTYPVPHLIFTAYFLHKVWVPYLSHSPLYTQSPVECQSHSRCLINTHWINVEWKTEREVGRQDQNQQLAKSIQSSIDWVSYWARGLRGRFWEIASAMPRGETQLKGAIGKLSLQIHSHIYLFRRKWGLGLTYVWLTLCHKVCWRRLVPCLILMASLQGENVIEPRT